MPNPGSYKLEIFNTKFYFEPVVIYILSDEEVTNYPNKKQIQAYLYDTKTGGKGQRLLYPLQLDPSHIIQYFEIEEPFNPVQYMKNPYFMMIGFSVLMFYMMKAVPKEEMEEYQK